MPCGYVVMACWYMVWCPSDPEECSWGLNSDVCLARIYMIPSWGRRSLDEVPWVWDRGLASVIEHCTHYMTSNEIRWEWRVALHSCGQHCITLHLHHEWEWGWLSMHERSCNCLVWLCDLCLSWWWWIGSMLKCSLCCLLFYIRSIPYLTIFR